MRGCLRLISTIYRPEDLVHLSHDRCEIRKKVSVASAKQDRQASIKKLTLNACLKWGMTKRTEVTALTDGANSCWSVVNNLDSHCYRLLKILDWFHVGKKFKESESSIPNELKEKYNKGKWHCWHGNPETGIMRLTQLKEVLNDAKAIKKVNELITYISNNSKMIVNYHSRRLKGLPYTSQLAESSVNSVINNRQKNKKMQWSRKGAHHILQIRTSLYGKSWEEDWNAVEELLYQKAV